MFPITMTIHTPAQLNAVLAALQPELEASDFKDPTVGAAYQEVVNRIATRDANDGPRTTGKSSALGAGYGQGDSSATVTADKQQAARDSTAAGKAGKATKGTPALDGLADKDAKTAEALTGDANASEASAVTYDQVKPLIIELSKKKGRDAAVGALQKFGADAGPALKPEQYADFVAHANGLLKAA